MEQCSQSTSQGPACNSGTVVVAKRGWIINKIHEFQDDKAGSGRGSPHAKAPPAMSNPIHPHIGGQAAAMWTLGQISPQPAL